MKPPAPLAPVGNRGLIGAIALACLAGLVSCGGGGGGSGGDTTSGGSSGGTSGGTSGSTTTAPVACSYTTSFFNTAASVNAQATSSWACSTSQRTLTSNGIPDHAVGTFPNAGNPNRITAQSISVSYTLTPALTGSVNAAPIAVGYALNGIKFEPGTGGTCNDAGTSCPLAGGTGTWRIEALGQTAFNFGTDFNNAHVQPTGEYHYHGLPERFLDKLGKGEQMTLVGWAADGFPVYAKYGYTRANDAASPVKVLAPSYRIKAAPDANRPAVSLYPMGTFTQDYEYVSSLGDLDECNGRTGVTPEFPSGIYHYVITAGYPYIHRCVKGSAAASPPPRP